MGRLFTDTLHNVMNRLNNPQLENDGNPDTFTHSFTSILQGSLFSAIQQQANFQLRDVPLNTWLGAALAGTGCAAILQATHGLHGGIPHFSQSFDLPLHSSFVPPFMDVKLHPTVAFSTPEYATAHPNQFSGFTFSGYATIGLPFPGLPNSRLQFDVPLYHFPGDLHLLSLQQYLYSFNDFLGGNKVGVGVSIDF